MRAALLQDDEITHCGAGARVVATQPAGTVQRLAISLDGKSRPVRRPTVGPRRRVPMRRRPTSRVGGHRSLPVSLPPPRGPVPTCRRNASGGGRSSSSPVCFPPCVCVGRPNPRSVNHV
jgi:hypothetical protein